jgi:hypothetical protein
MNFLCVVFKNRQRKYNYPDGFRNNCQKNSKPTGNFGFPVVPGAALALLVLHWVALLGPHHVGL